MAGTLYGVGVGPGDPELVTLKALRILTSVPVLAWPAPEEGPSLAREIVAGHLPGTQREIAIRMPLLPARFPADDVYDSAAVEIGAALSAGDDVAVICEGDPFFYGSFMYLFGRLAADHAIDRSGCPVGPVRKGRVLLPPGPDLAHLSPAPFAVARSRSPILRFIGARPSRQGS